MTTSSNYYQLYIDRVLQLASTIVLKSEDSATGLNRYVSDYYGADAVDVLHPASWKYYLNISGAYHPTDTVMSIVSLDTLETIIFSRETLAIHTATAAAYVYGTRQYIALITKYPSQEMLILGILYPVDLQKAIDATDGAILGYPATLVEVNEYSLISRLQTWIYGYKLRWTNKQYGISDSLYPATALGILYLNLVPAILSFRLDACKTNEAHSFHVTQYLASHGFLDAYMGQLTTKQSLFFYRNIAYIELNAGKSSTFKWLIEHIMTERLLPIAEYEMRHDLFHQPSELYPTLSFRRNPLNLGYSADLINNITLEELLVKEDRCAAGNIDYRQNSTNSVRVSMENSLSNVLLTKVVESSVIDYSNSSPYTLEDILINHWLSLSTAGVYTAYVNVVNPESGETLSLTAAEAYVFVWYAFCTSIGINLTVIPKTYAKRVQRVPLVTASDIWSITDYSLVSYNTAISALSLQPVITKLISTQSFYDACLKIYNAAQMQRGLCATQEHRAARAQVSGLVSRIYSDQICTLSAVEQTYGAWFTQRNIDVSKLTKADFATMYLDIVQKATGLSINTSSSLKTLQAAMLKMLAQLSSYSVQFITQINGTNIQKTDWTAVRVGDQHASSSMCVYSSNANVDVIDVGSNAKSATELNINISKICNLRLHRNNLAHLRLNVKANTKGLTTLYFGRWSLNPINAKQTTPPTINTSNIVPVLGLNYYLALTTTQQQNLKDIYNNGYSSLPRQ